VRALSTVTYNEFHFTQLHLFYDDDDDGDGDGDDDDSGDIDECDAQRIARPLPI